MKTLDIQDVNRPTTVGMAQQSNSSRTFNISDFLFGGFSKAHSDWSAGSELLRRAKAIESTHASKSKR